MPPWIEPFRSPSPADWVVTNDLGLRDIGSRLGWTGRLACSCWPAAFGVASGRVACSKREIQACRPRPATCSNGCARASVGPAGPNETSAEQLATFYAYFPDVGQRARNARQDPCGRGGDGIVLRSGEYQVRSDRGPETRALLPLRCRWSVIPGNCAASSRRCWRTCPPPAVDEIQMKRETIASTFARGAPLWGRASGPVRRHLALTTRRESPTR